MMPTFTTCTNTANATTPSSDHINDAAKSCDEHIKRPRTPLPTPISTPADPQPDQALTPLRRRFLEEVGMSPATPPRTPSPTKNRASPSKTSESPSKGKGSPTKQNLEIVPGGFYFSCELPMSKITPKKKKDEDVRTPTRRAPSPTKMGGGTPARTSKDASPAKQPPSKRASPEKQTPSKAPHKIASTNLKTPTRSGVGSVVAIKASATKNGIPSKSATPGPLSSTPLRKPTTPSRNSEQSGRPSPTKSIKLASRIAQDAVTPRPIRSAARLQGVKQNAGNEETVKLANSSSTNSTRPSLSSVDKAQTRPVRAGSFNIGESMAALKKNTTQPRKMDSEHFAGGSDDSGPPTPLRRAAEKLEHTGFVRMSDIRHAESVKESEVQTQSVPSPNAMPESHIYASPLLIKEQTSHYRPAPLALDAPTDPELNPTPPTFKKQVKFLGSEPSPRRLPRPVLTMRRAGTDPLLHLAMRQEMSTLSKSLSDSLGIDFSSTGRQNMAVLPSMASTLLGSKQGTPHPKTRDLSVPTTSDVTDVSNASGSSIGTARASPSMTQNQPATPIPPNVAKVTGKLLPKGIPARVSKEISGVAKNPDEHTLPRKVVSHASGFARPQSATSMRTATPLKKTSAHARNGTPLRARATQGTPKPMITATPAKPKSTSTFPQSARKSAFDSPARQTATPARCKASTCTPQATAQKEPTPDPVFVNAQDIAARVAAWNAPPSPPPQAQPEARESYTPKGSPLKSTSPTSTLPKPKTPTSISPKARTPPSVLPARIVGMTPKRAAPATPRTVARVRGGRSDPMASRTPSKGIQESLGRAIDRKIEEDRRRRRG